LLIGRVHKQVCVSGAHVPKTGGLFLFYENTSRIGECRDDWLARCGLQRPGWTAYNDADWNTMRDHVRSADFPDSVSDWLREPDSITCASS